MSGDLRAAVEGLTRLAMVGPLNDRHIAMVSDGHLLERSAVLDLIPEGAVLVTEDQLEIALTATIANFWQPDGWDADELASDVKAYSLPYLLAKLREGT